MTSSGKNQKNHPKKSKRLYKQTLTEEGMAGVLIEWVKTSSSQTKIISDERWNAL